MRSAACVALAGVIVLFASPSFGDPAVCSDNDCLIAADRKSVDAARQGHYVEASFGLLAAIGVDAADKIHDEDVFDQWSQVWSAMTRHDPTRGSTSFSRSSKRCSFCTGACQRPGERVKRGDRGSGAQ